MLPKAGKKKTITLGVSERTLAGSIRSFFPHLTCETSETSEAVADLLRGLRQHSGKLVKKLQPNDIDRALLGLGHAYSRGKVKFSINKNDNRKSLHHVYLVKWHVLTASVDIIQSIATLDQVRTKELLTVIPFTEIRVMANVNLNFSLTKM